MNQKEMHLFRLHPEVSPSASLGAIGYHSRATTPQSVWEGVSEDKWIWHAHQSMIYPSILLLSHATHHTHSQKFTHTHKQPHVH